jgi:hypothetical protein
MTRKPSKGRPDPYRRNPPTIDLSATEVTTTPAATSDEAQDPVKSEGAAAGSETAIEPIAAIGLDGDRTPRGDVAPGAPTVEPADRRPPEGETPPPVGEVVNADLVEPEADTGRIVAAAPPPDAPAGVEPAAGTASSTERSDLSATTARTVPSFASRVDADRLEPSAPPTLDPDPVQATQPTDRARQPNDTPRPPVATPSKAGGGRAMTAGLLGGLVGAGLATAGAMWFANSSDLGGRVATLESRPAAASVAGDALAMVERRIVALETADRTLAERLSRAESSAEANTRRLAELTGRPAAPVQTTPAPAVPGPGAPAAPSVPTPTPAPATPVPVAAQPAPAPRVEVAEAPAFRELAGRVTAVESAVQQARQNGEALGQLQSRLAELDGEVRQRTEAATRSVGDLGTRLAALERTTTEGLRGATTALEAGQARAAELDQRAAALSSELSKLNPQAIRAGLRLVVATRLGDQLRTGTAFGPSLTTLERLDAPPATVAALKPFASALPPTTATLLQDFAPLKARILDEARSPADTVGERLLRMADKVVTVRAVGDGSGSDLPGLVGRIETSLSRGDAAGAATAWDALPAPARDISSEWGARLKARLAVEGAVRQVATDALAALDGSAR